MASMKDFWSQDRTTIHQKSNWFEKLPLLQRITYILLLLFVICWCFYLGMAYAMATAPELPPILDGNDWQNGYKGADGEDEEINIVHLEGTEVVLLVGADKRPGEKAYRTDTIILAFFNGDTNELKLLSIPRDSYVQLPGTSTKTKINEAYFYGGVTLLENTIEYTFGIEVDKYVEMDFSAFLQVIDLFKGVEIDVPKRMYKPTEEIDIQPGRQILNGYDSLAFVRYRDSEGDVGRIQRQQAFMHALASKIASEATIWKAPQLVNIALEYTRTNYTLSKAMNLGAAVMQSDLTNIGMYTMPGEGRYLSNGTNYWFLYKNKGRDIINEITGGKAGDMHILDIPADSTEYPPKKPTEEENPDEENPVDETPDTEGSWSSGPGETEQPAGETPAEEMPAEEQPSGEQPPEEQPPAEETPQ